MKKIFTLFTLLSLICADDKSGLIIEIEKSLMATCWHGTVYEHGNKEMEEQIANFVNLGKDKKFIINYYTDKTSNISIKYNILENQLYNIENTLKRDKLNNNISWFHNIPLFNPISLSYILSNINCNSNIIFDDNNDIITLCNYRHEL